MTFGSLFAGIGGLDLGLERAGMVCKWQVEIDEYATQVLEKHWPDVPKFRDVREFDPPATVDLICGGFPCQDVSDAGSRIGINGKRSGLWFEMLRIVRRVRPSYVIVENVAGLLYRGLDDVLGGLAESGYAAEWQVLSAAATGKNHCRERLFVLAYADLWNGIHSDDLGVNGRFERSQILTEARTHVVGRNQTEQESPVPRVADGIPNQLDRLRGLGNAVVPQVAEYIGRRIIEHARMARGRR